MIKNGIFEKCRSFSKRVTLEKALKKMMQELHSAKKNLAGKDALTNKRDELEEIEERLLAEVEEKRLELHRKSESDQEESQKLSLGLKRLEEQFHQATKDKREVDRLIDLLEYTSAEEIELLKKNLVEAILEQFPEQNSNYEELQFRLQGAQKEFAEIAQIEAGCKKLNILLSQTLEMRKTVKQKGLLSYILGTNPNVTISLLLKGADEIAGHLISISKNGLEKIRHDPLLTQKCIDFVEFLETFRVEAKKTWGFRHIDTKITHSWEILGQFDEFFKNELQELDKKLNVMQLEIDRWIENQAEKTE